MIFFKRGFKCKLTVLYIFRSPVFSILGSYINMPLLQPFLNYALSCYFLSLKHIQGDLWFSKINFIKKILSSIRIAVAIFKPFWKVSLDKIIHFNIEVFDVTMFSLIIVLILVTCTYVVWIKIHNFLMYILYFLLMFYSFDIVHIL